MGESRSSLDGVEGAEECSPDLVDVDSLLSCPLSSFSVHSPEEADDAGWASLETWSDSLPSPVCAKGLAGLFSPE